MQDAPGADATKHSRACENCYKAKARCVPYSGRDSDKCSRCHRLQKNCVTPSRKPRKKRSPNVATTTAQLELKIESLVALLSSGRAPLPVPPTSTASTTSTFGHSPTESHGGSTVESRVPTCLQELPSGREIDSVKHAWCQDEHPLNVTAVLTPATSSGSVVSDPDAREENADRLLNLFRDQFAIHIPLALVFPDDTALELQATRPWLFKTIMMLVNQDERNEQIEQGIQIARGITEAMLIRGEKSIDMLQALLVFNSWSYYFTSQTPHALSTGFVQLAIGLISDLSLNRPARLDDGFPAEIERWALNDHRPNDLKRTLEERRALLYCYLLTSTSANCIKKIESLQSSPYIEHCCQVLLGAPQTESDIILGYSVKMQCLIDSMNRIVAETSDSSSNKAPIWMHMASARMGLQNIWTSVPLNVRDSTFMRLKYHNCEILLYDSAILKHLFPPSSNSQRLDMLYACLLSAKSFLDLVLEQPLSSYAGFSILTLSQVGHALSTLMKLCFVEEDGWNLANVRESVNLRAYFHHLISRHEQAGATIDRAQRAGPCRVSFPTGCSRAMRRVQAAYDAKIAAETSAESEQQVGFPGATPAYSALDETLTGVPFENFDFAYWEAIVGDFTQ